MTRAQDIRKELLLRLYGSRPLALTASYLVRQCGKEDFQVTPAEADAELVFLADQGFLQSIEDPVSGEARWRITSDGVLEYEKSR